jgi:hypothetical protein
MLLLLDQNFAAQTFTFTLPQWTSPRPKILQPWSWS